MQKSPGIIGRGEGIGNIFYILPEIEEIWQHWILTCGIVPDEQPPYPRSPHFLKSASDYREPLVEPSIWKTTFSTHSHSAGGDISHGAGSVYWRGRALERTKGGVKKPHSQFSAPERNIHWNL